MAKIEMDISEYNQIMENKRLLEEALDREQELNNTIRKLEQEKIKALEDAKMQVIHKKIIEHRTQHIVKNPVTFVRRMLLNAGLPVPEQVFSRITRQELEWLYVNHIEEHKFTSEQQNPEVTIIGLDEVKTDIRKELREQMLKEIQDAEEKSKKFTSLMNEISKLTTQNDSAIDRIETLLNDTTRLEGELVEHQKVIDKQAKIIETLESKIKKIKDLVTAAFHFTVGGVKNDILKLIK
jgi:hypothetical protein